MEYAPPKPQDLPYESDDFPLGCLNYEPLKPGNLTRGIYRAYHMEDVDEEGMTKADRQWKAKHDETNQKIDEAILKSMEEDWVVGDVPETFAFRQKKAVPTVGEVRLPKKASSSSIKPPPTVTFRKAVSALGLQARPDAIPVATKVLAKPKPNLPFLTRPKPSTSLATDKSSTMRHNAAIAASKSTIGYSKGRSASGAIPPQRRQGGMTRTISNLSQTSDVTITPARFAQHEERESKRLPWLTAFDADDESVEPIFRGEASELLKRLDNNEEEFVMTLGL